MGAVLVVLLVSGALVSLRPQLDLLDAALLYLLLCLGFGAWTGSGPAAAVAVLSFLAFNFFFIPPYHTFAVDQEHHGLTLIAFLGAALVTGQLVARVKERTDAAEREQRRTALLYELNAALVREVDLGAVLDAIVERVVSVYGAASCRILLPAETGGVRIAARYPPAPSDPAPVPIDDGGETARRVLERPDGRLPEVMSHDLDPARRGTRTSLRGDPVVPVLSLPIATADRTIGVLEVVGRPDDGRFEEEDEQLLTSFADQAALALERVRLLEEAARSAVLARSDELKSALLAAVSHDLRTPLATIKTSVTSLLDPSIAWDDTARGEFLAAIDEETDRLALLVDNLLDLSRIEGGVLHPQAAWYDVAELVGDVARRLSALAGGRPLTTGVAADLPLACFDYVEIRQVLLNLGENALKYTPAGTAIRLTARLLPDAIELAVADVGPGLDHRALRHMFDKFYRADPDGRVPGTGIGLTISKGLVEANGGRIWAESQPGVGTTLRFTLPLDPGTAT